MYTHKSTIGFIIKK